MSNIECVKPVITKHGIKYICPNCNSIQEDSSSYFSYCPICGQKLSWLTVNKYNISVYKCE